MPNFNCSPAPKHHPCRTSLSPANRRALQSAAASSPTAGTRRFKQAGVGHRRPGVAGSVQSLDPRPTSLLGQHLRFPVGRPTINQTLAPSLLCDLLRHACSIAHQPDPDAPPDRPSKLKPWTSCDPLPEGKASRKAAMSQSQQYAAPRRQNTTGSAPSVSASSSYSSAPPPASTSNSTQLPAGDELHMSGMSPQQLHMSPQNYAPQITLDQAPSASAHTYPDPHSHPRSSQYQPASAVPNVLQPGLSARPAAVSANTAPTLPTLQGTLPPQQDYRQSPQDFQTPSKPSLNMSHSYSRSSPAAGYDTPGYHPYTPTTPGGGPAGGSSSSQFMSPSDIPKYGGIPPTGRTVSNTPLGLADIRPRADSSMSEGAPGSLSYDLANPQPTTSNYMTPWPMYAFDWCKWPSSGNSAGKLAVGSYLEDGHNFVSLR